MEGYWDGYYGRTGDLGVEQPPSQFGVFVASEFAGKKLTIVEFGCGSGRDTLFFAGHGFSVIGTDASASAIDICRSRAHGKAHFLCSEVENPDLLGELQRLLNGQSVLVYARFFIHAVDEAGESAFLALAAELCKRGGAVAVEFRTRRDEALAKVTPAHYRRFVDPMQFLVRAQSKGFQASYFVEGFGYAKFKEDDAHVARFVLLPATDAAEEMRTYERSS